jgi:hypothetical protein
MTATAMNALVHGAWGMGHGAWGMGHGAWGMGHGAWGIVRTNHGPPEGLQLKEAYKRARDSIVTH